MLIKNQVFGSGGETVKNVIVFGELQDLGRGVSLSPRVLALLRAMNPRENYAIGSLVGKRLQQHVVDNAKNRSGCADSQSESGDRDHRESDRERGVRADRPPQLLLVPEAMEILDVSFDPTDTRLVVHLYLLCVSGTSRRRQPLTSHDLLPCAQPPRDRVGRLDHGRCRLLGSFERQPFGRAREAERTDDRPPSVANRR